MGLGLGFRLHKDLSLNLVILSGNTFATWDLWVLQFVGERNKKAVI